MRSFVLRLLTVDDTPAFLRLKEVGLSTSPDSFVGTLEEDPPDYPDRVRRRLEGNSARSGDVILGAFDPHLVGIVSVTREIHAKRRHKAHLHGMYVVPECRGRGVGRALLAEVLRLASEMHGLEEVHLIVATHNTEAAALYRRFGFVETWTEARALKVADHYVDAHHMVLPRRGSMRDTSDASGRTREEQDAHFMELALRQAAIAVRRGQTPFGAVVVDREGSLIGEGHNRVRADLDPTAHGEVVAIREAWRRVGAWPRLAGGTVYSSCEPCLLCAFVITQVGFARVVFAARGTDLPGYRPLLAADLAKAATWVNAQADWTPLEVVGDFMRGRALEIIAAFPWAEAQSRSSLGRF